MAMLWFGVWDGDIYFYLFIFDTHLDLYPCMHTTNFSDHLNAI